MIHKSRKRPFNDVYRIDKNTDFYMIEIALDNYSEIFNPWDSAPLEMREIDPELEYHLETCSDDIPFQYAIEFYMVIPQGMKNKTLEEASREGIKNHFAFKVHLLKEQLNDNKKRAFFLLLAGFLLLGLDAVLVATSIINPNKIWIATLEQALIISGWVFIWEAVSQFFLKNRETYHKYRTYKRLRDAPIFFQEAETSSL